MTPSLVVATSAVTALLVAWAATAAALDRLPGRRFLQALFLLQGLLVAQLAHVLYLLGGGERPAETSAFAAYLVLSLLLLPGGLALSAEERTRYGTLTLLIALVALAVVESRLVATWS